ncbi:MAG TPA: signal peptidase I [Ruminococcaceae bacterium]|nr:signal peptidase I [Oscillospiraceae bacterium]HCT15898.1 signal peptidase I [Oscillospiraceae bacterium]
MKKAGKIFSRVMAVLSALIFIIGLTVFVSVLNASAGKVPSVLGFSVLQVQTGSMEPEIPVGGIVITFKVNPDSLKVGDVISFYSNDTTISGKVNTHRIVEINDSDSGEKIFKTKGDANDAVDEAAVYQIDLIGKVIVNIGTVGSSVLSVLRNPKIILIFIVIPLIFITMGEAVNLAKLIAEYKFSDQKDEEDEKSSQTED